MNAPVAETQHDLECLEIWGANMGSFKKIKKEKQDEIYESSWAEFSDREENRCSAIIMAVFLVHNETLYA